MPSVPSKKSQPSGRLYWQTTDNSTIRLYVGEVVQALRLLATGSVQCVMTSPPYWGLRDYGVEGQIGSETSPDCGTQGQAQCGACFVCSMVGVFREVRRVLRGDGTLWLNLGDTYGGGKRGGEIVFASGRKDGRSDDGGINRTKQVRRSLKDRNLTTELKTGNLVGVPWRVALALQADGWVLRQDIIWCLSGGTWLYVRGQKGEVPLMLGDLARYPDPTQFEVWNGERWTRLRGISKSSRVGDELEIVLRSGERISCTPSHQFPTEDGRLVKARNLRIGDKLVRCRLPEPDNPKCPQHVTKEAAWFAGLYLAEGCGVEDGKIKIAGHRKEIQRWNKVQRIVKSYGGTCSVKLHGNQSTISVYGKLICAVVRELVSGKDAKTKCFSPKVWKYDNGFIESMVDGYLSGDGSRWTKGRENWGLGFTRNYNLERDLRIASARLGWAIIIRLGVSKFDGNEYPGFGGELRKVRSGHHNEKSREEIIEIRKSRCRETYDVGVEDAPNLFALASGILTHNSKPSPMPESIKNRCTKAHEYVFLLTKSGKYYYDAEAIKSDAEPAMVVIKSGGRKFNQNSVATFPGKTVVTGNKANKRSVWEIDTPEILLWLEQNAPEVYEQYRQETNKYDVWRISSQGYNGAHFAVFPTTLVEPCIKAGTSEKGCCGKCGAPWRRVVEQTQLKRERPNEYVKRTGEAGTGNSCANTVAGVQIKTLGWEPTCGCFGKQTRRTVEDKKSVLAYESDIPLEDHPVVPCTVLDPFIGSGTTCAVALSLDRYSIGVDLNEQYLRDNAVPRLEGALLSRPALVHLIPSQQAERIEIGRSV